MNLKAYLALCGVFVGCCSSVIFLELLVKHDPGAGHLITFSQFFFIACHGLIFTSKFFTVKPVIAMKDYVTLVIMFFITNVLNNYAFNFDISMPLYMIFRAGSLMANMVMGIVILRKSYDLWKYFSVILITLGIIVCTIASGSKKKIESESVQDGFSGLFWWSIGIFILSAALFLSARMGIYQEVLYKKYGKHPEEALFFTHILPLPAFLFLSKNIFDHFMIAFQSERVEIVGFAIPIQIVYLIGNMSTQYMCTSSVYVLTSECPSLTVTLVITLRKFASLLFSIIYFKNPFTTYHWIGTLFVFIGTVIFTEIIPNVMNHLKTSKTFEQSKNISSNLVKLSIEKTQSIRISKVHGKYKKLEQEDSST